MTNDDIEFASVGIHPVVDINKIKTMYRALCATSITGKPNEETLRMNLIDFRTVGQNLLNMGYDRSAVNKMVEEIYS